MNHEQEYNKPVASEKSIKNHTHSSNFYHIFRVLFVLGRIFGFSTIPIRKGRSLDEVPSPLLGYAIVVFLSSIVLNISSVIYMFVGESTIVHEDHRILSSAGLAGPNVAASLSLWHLFWLHLKYRSKLHWIFTEITAVASILKCDCSPLRRTLKRELLYMVFTVTWHVATFLKFRQELLLKPFSLFVVLLNWIIATVQQFQMYNVLLVIQMQFQHIHRQIASLARVKNESQHKLTPCAQKKNSSVTSKILRLQSIYFRIIDLCSAWDQLFGTQNILLALNSFVAVISFAYLSLEIIMDLFILKHRNAIIFTGSLWVASSSLSLLIIVSACEKVVKTARETHAVIFQASSETEDNDLRDKLEMFSLQLLHSKVTFTASGFFAMDTSLLSNMVAAIFTYLVVIIQFQLAYMPAEE